jgi:hypothetical protein
MWARTFLSLVIALPIAAIAIGTAGYRFDQLFDPCVAWGVGDTGSGYRAVADPCKEHTGYGETKTHFLVMMAAVQGVLLLCAALGVVGAACSRPKLTILAGVLMTFEIVPTIFSIAPLVALTGAGFIIMGIKLQNRKKPAASLFAQ